MLSIAVMSVVCNATIFGYAGDKWAGGNASYLKRPVASYDVGVAHRTWKLGSTVLVKNPRTKLTALALVVDRGPYGATDDSGMWVLKRKREDPGQWRGCVDLTPALAKSIKHNGYEKVYIRRVKLQELVSTVIKKIEEQSEVKDLIIFALATRN